jgi:hypothetical protein
MVKLRDWTTTPDERSGRTLSPGTARGVKQTTHHSLWLTEDATRDRSNRLLGIMQPSTEVHNALGFLEAQGAVHRVSGGVTKQ